jgi:hypothetical protein
MSSGTVTNVSGLSAVNTCVMVHDLPAVVHDEVPVGLLGLVAKVVETPSGSVTVISYAEIVSPPVSVGASQATMIDPGLALTFDGAPGVVAGTTVAESASESPAPLTANTETRYEVPFVSDSIVYGNSLGSSSIAADHDPPGFV